MSLYSQYIKEREDKETIENDRGFLTYFFIPQGCYIQDLYVSPDYRHSHEASQLADQVVEIAKQKGISKLYGSVSPNSQGGTDSLKVLLAYGFKLDSCGPAGIIMVKDI